MQKVRRLFGIVPARAGSKGLPGKNQKILFNKPLVCHSLDAAIGSQYELNIVVSTNDPIIVRHVEASYRGVTCLGRAPELCDDNARIVDVLLDLIDRLSMDDEDLLITLQPTSPLRRSEHIDEAISLNLNNLDSSIISVTKLGHSENTIIRCENGRILNGETIAHNNRQSYSDLYLINGAIYSSTVSNFVANHGYFGEKMIPFEMARSFSIDIDDELDFDIAEFLLKGMR